MTGKDENEYTSEEKNIYSALRQFSDNLESDLKLLGNFDEVKAIFEEVVTEKEQILERKAKSSDFPGSGCFFRLEFCL